MEETKERFGDVYDVRLIVWVLIVVSCIAVTVILVVGHYDRKEKAEVARTSFEVSGSIESIKEKTGYEENSFFFFSFSQFVTRTFITVDGKSYEVNIRLLNEVKIDKGMIVEASGNKGVIKELTITK